MPKKALENISQSERLRNRVIWCRQLAEGAGDREFAARLHAISAEFEGSVTRPLNWRKNHEQRDGK